MSLSTKHLSLIAFAIGLGVLLSMWGGVIKRIGSPGDMRPRSVTLWSNSGSPDVERRTARDFEERHPDIRVNLKFRESGSITDAVFTSFLSGSPPDMMNVKMAELRDYVSQGMIRPLDDLLEAELKQNPNFLKERIGAEAGLIRFTVDPNDRFLREMDQFPKEAARLLAMHGRLIAINGVGGLDTLTYNKRLFREAAVMFPDAGLVDENNEPIPPRTWSELVQKAHIISEYGRKSGRNVYGLVVQGQRPRDLMRGIKPLAATAGTSGFNFRGQPGPDGKIMGGFEYENPGMIGAFKLIMILKRDGSVMPGTESREYEQPRTLVAQGSAAMLIDGWHAALVGSERVPLAKYDLASAPVPVPDDAIEQRLGMKLGRGKQPLSAGTEMTCITTGAKHPEAVWKWMHFGSSPEMQQRHTQSGRLPGTHEALKKFGTPEEREWFPMPFQRQVWEVYEKATANWPQTPDVGPVKPTHEDILHAAFYESDSVPLDDLVATVQQRVAAYSAACNADLRKRVALGEARVASFTFPDFDPLAPEKTYDLQRSAGADPELNAQIAALRAKLPAHLQNIELLRFEPETSAWQLAWIPALMLLCAGGYVAWASARRKPGETPVLRQMSRTWESYIFVAPMMITLFAFVIYPSLYQVYLSFHSSNGISPLRPVGFENFQRIFQDKTFWTLVVPNTLQYMVFVTVFQIALGLFFAQLLNVAYRAGGLIRLLFFIPLVTSLSAVSVVFIGLLSGSDSLVNQMLAMINGPLAGIAEWINSNILAVINLPWRLPPGLSPDFLTIDWLGDKRFDLYTVIAVSVWHGLPYTIILCLAGLQSISPELYEAAKVDGAGPAARFRHITIPELMPILTVIIFNSLVGAAKAFGAVFILTEGGKEHSSEVVATYIFKYGFTSPPDQRPDVGYASAMGIVYALVLGFLTFINVRIIAKRWKRNLAPTAGDKENRTPPPAAAAALAPAPSRVAAAG